MSWVIEKLKRGCKIVNWQKCKMRRPKGTSAVAQWGQLAFFADASLRARVIQGWMKHHQQQLPIRSFGLV